MKTISLLFCMLLCFALSGCGGFLGDGRMEAWKDVRKEEEKTRQKFLEAKKVELENKKPAASQNPTLKLTAFDADGRVTSTAEMDLQPVIAEITGGKKTSDTYGVNLAKTDMPTGEFAENAEAGGNALAKVASSPGTVAIAMSYNERKRADDSGDTTMQAETITVNDSLNRTETHNTGAGTMTYQGTAPAAEPIVVEPFVVEQQTAPTVTDVATPVE